MHRETASGAGRRILREMVDGSDTGRAETRALKVRRTLYVDWHINLFAS